MSILQTENMLQLETKNCQDIKIDHQCFINKTYKVNLQSLKDLQSFALELKSTQINELIDCYWGEKTTNYGICYKYATVLCSLILTTKPQKDIFVLICHDHNFYDSIHATVVFQNNNEWFEIDLTKDNQNTIANKIPLHVMADRIICVFNNQKSYINVSNNFS